MSDRKHEHVEPRNIAGADLPKFLRPGMNPIAVAFRVGAVVLGIVIAVIYTLANNLPAGWTL